MAVRERQSETILVINSVSILVINLGETESISKRYICLIGYIQLFCRIAKNTYSAEKSYMEL